MLYWTTDNKGTEIEVTKKNFYICAVHLDTIESFIYPTDAQLDCSKMLKYTLKFT
jgi:hypothetical protein